MKTSKKNWGKPTLKIIEQNINASTEGAPVTVPVVFDGSGFFVQQYAS